MPNLNKIIIIGHVGQEPEMRFMPNGSPVTSFSVAVNSFQDKENGEKKEFTEWFSVQTFGKLAERMNQYLNKGSLIMVEGRYHLHSWQGQDNQSHYRSEINAKMCLNLSQSKNGEVPDEMPLTPEDLPF